MMIYSGLKLPKLNFLVIFSNYGSINCIIYLLTNIIIFIQNLLKVVRGSEFFYVWLYYYTLQK
jgi:hypothetical protein